MKLTYEQYMELIPPETKQMIEETLPYLWLYFKRNKRIRVKNEESFSYQISNNMIMAISTLLGAAKDQEIRSMFEGKKFNPSRIIISPEEIPKLADISKKEIFEQAGELFFPYLDITKYLTIKPIDIINRAIALCQNSYDSRSMLAYIGVDEELKEYLAEILKQDHQSQELQLERELFEHLPISTINYLEMASKIRTVLLNAYNNNSIEEQELLRNDDSYIVPISLLLAVYEYEGQERTEIVEYFKSKGITFGNITNHIKGISGQDTRYINRNLECIKQLYKRYYREGKNKDLQEKDIQVTDILSNVLDRTFTGVVIIDKLFEKLGTTTNAFDNLKESIMAEMERKKADEEANYAKSFYKELKRDTKDFINFTTKAYQLLLKKMQARNHNTEILNCEDDADTLSLYIASHFYKTDFETFYTDHGVTFEKVMQLLGISITREEIEKEELNQKLVIDKFRRFVLSGVNSNKRPENIFINDVVRNLCSREFNKSMIMENIFEEIRRDIDLPANFINNVESYLIAKEEARKRNLSEEYFIDKSKEVYDLLENACKAYTILHCLVDNEKFQEEEIIPLAILYAIFNTMSEINELYEYMGLTKTKLDRYLNIDSNRFTSGKMDIDLIINKIAPYINQTRESSTKKPLTIEEIGESIFTSKRKKTLGLSRLLAQYNLTYESFDDLTEVKKGLEQESQEKAIIAEANSFMAGCNSHAIDIIKDAVKIFQVIKESTDENIAHLTDDDMEDISILLSILKRKDLESYRYFKKYNISDQDIIGLLEITKDLKTKSSEKNYSAKCFLTHFKEYGSDNKNCKLTANDMLNTLLGKSSPIVRNALEALGIDFEVFAQECLTGKDYESTLTIDDRRHILDMLVTPDINMDTATSITTYGNELSGHTTFINEHCTEMTLKDPNIEATTSIQGILAKVYEKRKVQVRNRTWFEKLLGSEVETKEEVRLNSAAISELKSVVSRYIAPIYEDIKTFDSMVRYLETYRQKVLEHKEKTEEMLAHLDEDYQKVSADDFEKLLRLQTYRKAIESKKVNFELTNQLVKQYIYKTYLVMQNNLITIAGLEMSRDVLIPLLEAELMIGNSIQNQTNGATVTENIVKLLGEVISRNTVGIKQGLESIQSSEIPEEKLFALSKDIAEYLSQINNTTDPNTVTIEELPSSTPVLELSDLPKQKVYTNIGNNDIK